MNSNLKEQNAENEGLSEDFQYNLKTSLPMKKSGNRRVVNNSEESNAKLFISMQGSLDIIDMKGQDGFKSDQNYMNEIRQNTVSLEERIQPIVQQERIQPIPIVQEERTQPILIAQEERIQPIVEEERTQPIIQAERIQPVIQQERIQPIIPEETIQPIIQEERIQPIVPQEERIRPIVHEERIVESQRMGPLSTIGLALTGSGLVLTGGVTGVAAIAYEESIFLAAGTVGVTIGAALLTATMVAGVFKGLAWTVKRVMHRER